ncbi:hypothetical protein CHARACLAT_016627 [Characodon lateralis]|uniref:Uncharacterized protein n=1 Tax=Characodon lateralis TaxID=208331 RepID=A0ABU7D194_9TELE|nr:hypothetical protein [Characodon lateralis]
MKEERLDEINAPRSRHNAESCVWCLCFCMEHTSPTPKHNAEFKGCLPQATDAQRDRLADLKKPLTEDTVVV